jgi:hypothetical protein
MAIQSAWLLCGRLTARSADVLSDRTLAVIGHDYAAAWRRHFARRMYSAASVAHWAMRPWAVTGTLPLLAMFPSILTAGARLSGKTTLVSNTCDALTSHTPELAGRPS